MRTARSGRWRTEGRKPSAARGCGRGRWVGARGRRGRGLVLLLQAGPGRGRLAQPRGALVPARRRRRPGRRWLPSLRAETQTDAQEATSDASAPGSTNCGEYFRLWRDRRAIASPTHRLRPPPTASSPPSNFSRCLRAPPPRRAGRRGPPRRRTRRGGHFTLKASTAVGPEQ